MYLIFIIGQDPCHITQFDVQFLSVFYNVKFEYKGYFYSFKEKYIKTRLVLSEMQAGLLYLDLAKTKLK